MPKTKSVRVNIDEDLHRRVRFKALTQNTTLADVIRAKLRIWVEEEKPIVLPPTDKPNNN